MPISVHYCLTVLIWGLTWTAIRLQVKAAPVDLSVFYRFVIAALVAIVGLALFRRLPRMSFVQHRWLVLQGLTLYSINFLLIYRAAESMTTGLLAVVFSLAALSVSTWLEGFEWTMTAIIGAMLALLGNYVLFRRTPVTAPDKPL